MTSASELFYSRRSRIGRNGTELGFDSSSLRRSFHHLDNNNNNDNSHSHSRRRGHQRRVVGDCDTVRRPQHSRHLCPRPHTHESIRLDYGINQSGSGNSSNTETSSRRANAVGFGQNDRLPGAVLLARERLLERLRGVSLSGNRQNSRVSSGISWDDFPYGEDFRLAEAGEWETETSREWFTGGYPLTDSSSQMDLLSSLQDFNIKKPPGLSEEELKCLHRVVFKATEKDDDDEVAPGIVKDCSICLDKFLEGDDLIHLPCRHRFHLACLYPWVRTCGDCPYCRRGILFHDHSNTGKKTPSPPTLPHFQDN